jgi:hypothetical protein
LLSGLVGIVLSLSLAVLGVYSGTTASQRAQEVSFILALLGPLIGTISQLLLMGPHSSSFLYGLLLSVTASSTNLFLNKRQATSGGAASSGGGFIPGRDQPTPEQRRRAAAAAGRTPANDEPESHTPMCVSPAQQWRSLKSKS